MSTLTTEKLVEIEAQLRTYRDGILMCNTAMLDAADMLKAQAAEIERLTRERDGKAESVRRTRGFLSDAQHRAGRLAGELSASEARAIAAEAKVSALMETLNTPEIFDFVKAVQLEAAHQRERWGTEHDAGKTDADWFWLVGYLAGKALHNPANDMTPHEAQLHRIVATAAALANWHLAKLGLTNMRPGIEPPVDAALGAKP